MTILRENKIIYKIKNDCVLSCEIERRCKRLFDKASIKLLQLLMKSKCVNELQSYPINKILPLVDWSYSKTYNIIVELLKEGYIGKGMKDERADTFYITDKGVCTLTTIISKIRREGEAVVNER